MISRHNALQHAAAALRGQKIRYRCECGREFKRLAWRTKHWERGPVACRLRHETTCPQVPRVNLGVKVPCLTCGATFPNAIEMGLHKTQVHFLQEYDAQRRNTQWVN